MDSKLYEELCRRFIAVSFALPLESITSPRIPNPQRLESPSYTHQIDLYWEVENGVALYKHIANAKWRASGKIEQGDVLLLQQVRQRVAAHKALLIASVEFTAGAIAAANDEGIGLHIVRPSFDYINIPTRDRAEMQDALTEVSGALFSHEIVHRGADLPSRPAENNSTVQPVAPYTTRDVTNYTTRADPERGTMGRDLGGPSSGAGGSPYRGGGGSGFTRDGDGGIVRR